MWCLHGTCRTEGCCSRTHGDLFPSTYPFPGLLPELLPRLESAGGQLWVNGGRWVRRCSGFALPLCWAVSKKHQASTEWIFCRFADLTELLSLIAQKAAGRLFCIPHGKQPCLWSGELPCNVAYCYWKPGMVDSSGKLVGKQCVYSVPHMWSFPLHPLSFSDVSPCHERDALMWVCVWNAEKPPPLSPCQRPSQGIPIVCFCLMLQRERSRVYKFTTKNHLCPTW